MPKYLQSYIVPICTYTPNGGAASFDKLYGSAFLINSNGWCVTAVHVLRAALEEGKENLRQVGIVGKANQGRDNKNVLSPISTYEFAPSPFDVAVFKSPYVANTLFRTENLQVLHWQEVATLGYPENAIGKELTKFRLNLRAQRGHIQRLIFPNELPFGEHPPAFELNFLISRGMSGAPVFIHSQPFDIVIGVCVSSFRSELIDDEIVEVNDDGSKYVERKVKIEEYGIAHDIRPLLSWKADIFDGKSLGEMFAKD